jgi:hypothetical protein
MVGGNTLWSSRPTKDSSPLPPWVNCKVAITRKVLSPLLKRVPSPTTPRTRRPPALSSHNPPVRSTDSSGGGSGSWFTATAKVPTACRLLPTWPTKNPPKRAAPHTDWGQNSTPRISPWRSALTPPSRSWSRGKGTPQGSGTRAFVSWLNLPSSHNAFAKLRQRTMAAGQTDRRFTAQRISR